jgi:transcription initiation factor TFIIB
VDDVSEMARVAESGNVTPTTVRTHHETLDELAV